MSHHAPTAFRRPEPGPSARRDALVALLGLALLAAWEAAGLDLPLVRLYGQASGFAWREHWLTARLLHDGARQLGWACVALLALSLWRPRLLLPALPGPQRLWWLATTLACVALIPLLKRASSTSCPWALAEFGGTVARHVPHWVLGLRDGGPGGCFPSGHASTAFALLPGWFVLRHHAPGAARRLLAVVLAAGLLLAWVQMMRGAHYLSHSLWTAWVCWSVGALSFHGTRAWQQRRTPAVLLAAEPGAGG